MIVSILFNAFVSAFVGVVVLGHVLLFTAIWPDALGKWPEPHLDTVDDGAPLIH